MNSGPNMQAVYDKMMRDASAAVTARPRKRRTHRLRWFVLAVVLLLVGGGTVFAWKTGVLLNTISGGNAKIFRSVMKSLPGVEDTLTGEKEGKINVLLLGMRGENVPGGGLLADTIMVLTIHPKANDEDTTRAALVSIPRDLFVTMPRQEWQSKINAVYAEGEKRARGGGMEDMRQVVSDITGLTIPYAVTINFQGFKDLVNALGGITVTLEQPFEEPLQFREPHVCDPYVFTVPTNPPQYEHKYAKRKNGVRYLAKSYLLCYNPNLECGGAFQLPAGDNVLDGDRALCYARARVTSNDFERAKRQQQVIEAMKKQAFSLGVVTDFNKVTNLINALGDNVRTNFEAWEMKRLYEVSLKVGGAEAPLTRRVLDTSDEGLLYHPENSNPAAGYILLPRGDNYDRIRELFQSLP